MKRVREVGEGFLFLRQVSKNLLSDLARFSKEGAPFEREGFPGRESSVADLQFELLGGVPS